jgi:hypothetical protein
VISLFHNEVQTAVIIGSNYSNCGIENPRLVAMAEATDKLFGSMDSKVVSAPLINQLLKTAWNGNMCPDYMRGLCWRILLGIIPSNDKVNWDTHLNRILQDYHDLKSRVMPSIDKVKDDPLSALSVGDKISDEWSAYYKNVELNNFIKGDLDRLFLTGLDDEYFQTHEKREVLLALLFIWSMEHPMTSYRQGMHEIIGVVLYVIETEQVGWERYGNDHKLKPLFTPQNVEAFAYSIFDRIMIELEPLYDPLPVAGAENQPFVVQFCTKIQGTI